MVDFPTRSFGGFLWDLFTPPDKYFMLGCLSNYNMCGEVSP